MLHNLSTEQLHFKETFWLRLLATNWLRIKHFAMRRDIFQAIADPTRRAIIELLAKKEMTPKTIAEHFDTSRQAISKHVRILKECELLKQSQQGREIYYSLNGDKMQEIDQWVAPFRSLWEKEPIADLTSDNSEHDGAIKDSATPSMSKQAVRRFTIC